MSTMKKTYDRSKLPLWAQREIERLERDLADATSRLQAGPEDSDTFADPYSDATRPLGEGPTIEFRLPGGRLRARIERGRLDLNGDQGIRIYPRATNSVEIEVGR